MRTVSRRAAVLVAIGITASTSTGQTPLGAAFTYQGRLELDGSAVDGSADFQFTLWDAEGGGSPPAGGSQVGAAVSSSNVPMDQGLFTVPIDFGVAALNGDARWLQVAVRSPAGSGPYQTLAPRQPLSATPYAVQTRGIYVDPNERVGIGTLSPLAAVHIFGGNLRVDNGEIQSWGPITLSPDVDQSGDDVIRFLDNLGGERMRIDSSGAVGIGTSTPQSTLHVRQPGDARIKVESTNNLATIELISDGGNGVSLYSPDDSDDFRCWVNGADRLSIRSTGAVGIGTNAPISLLELRGVQGETSTTYEQLQTFSVSGGPIGSFYRDYNGMRNYLGLESYNVGNTLKNPLVLQEFGGDVGIGTTTPQARLHVIGTTRTGVLEITGGSDVAEPYDIAPAGEIAPQAGMVVAIDPARVGQLRVASRAYDRTVAGIISGANGVSPGLTLAQTGTVAAGSMPVANVGRVWCWADADAGGAIEAGDLLTSSNTAGHAMKAVDPDRSHGAVIGKAMSSLPRGKGLVLVLVALQ